MGRMMNRECECECEWGRGRAPAINCRPPSARQRAQCCEATRKPEHQPSVQLSARGPKQPASIIQISPPESNAHHPRRPRGLHLIPPRFAKTVLRSNPNPPARGPKQPASLIQVSPPEALLPTPKGLPATPPLHDASRRQCCEATKKPAPRTRLQTVGIPHPNLTAR